MKRETAKALLENGVLQRWINGETIQVRQIFYNTWEDVLSPLFDCQPEDYRIKPKVEYKPYSPEEMAYYMVNKTVVLNTYGDKYMIQSISKEGIVLYPIPNGSAPSSYYSYEQSVNLRFEDGEKFARRLV